MRLKMTLIYDALDSELHMKPPPLTMIHHSQCSTLVPFGLKAMKFIALSPNGTLVSLADQFL